MMSHVPGPVTTESKGLGRCWAQGRGRDPTRNTGREEQAKRAWGTVILLVAFLPAVPEGPLKCAGVPHPHPRIRQHQVVKGTS